MINYIEKISLSLLIIFAVLIINTCSKEENPVIPDDPTLTLIYPVGSESLLANTATKIKWSSIKVDSISIHLSTNNGIDWVELVSSVSADLSEWDWMTPDILSDSCKIKIVSRSGSSIKDESDTTFSIYVTATISLLIPNGGEVWESRTHYSITWTSENLDKINIEFTSDNGSTWNIIGTNVTASTGEYIWETHYQPSDQNKIKIISSEYPQLDDESENNFAIVVAPGIIESLKYYPLAIGNRWVYTEKWICCYPFPTEYIYCYERFVLSDTVMTNGIEYYKVFEKNHSHYSPSNQIYWERVDRVNGKVYIYYENWNQQGDDELLIDDLWESPGRSVESHRYTNLDFRWYMETQILSQADTLLFGTNTKVRKYKEKNTFAFYDYSLVKDFGLIGWYQMLDDANKIGSLKGCVIDGVLYGDTTLVCDSLNVL